MYKLAVFDLDGTLLNRDHEISKENLNAVKKLEKLGLKIVLASGRPHTLMKPYIHQLNLKGPIIACNGAFIKKGLSGPVLYEKTIEKKQVQCISKLCKEKDYTPMFYTEEGILSSYNERVDFFIKRNEGLEDKLKSTIMIRSDACEISENYKIFKILVMEKDQDKYDLLVKDFEIFSSLSKTQSSSGFYDVMAPLTSKKSALEFLINYYGLSKNEVVAFGDQHNDLEMLALAGLSITTSNAVQGVKDLADYISMDHHDHGVAYSIENFLLKKMEV